MNSIISLFTTYLLVTNIALPIKVMVEENQRRSQVPIQEELKPGKKIIRELSTKDRHNYSIKLFEGQYLHLQVMQRGADLTAFLYSPQGEVVARGDRPNRMYGPKPIHYVSPKDGVYYLQIFPASANIVKGKYEVEVKALRPAILRDRELVIAQTLFSQAWKLQQEKAQERSDRKYLEALAAYQKIGELNGQALMMTQLGFIASTGGNLKQGVEWYEQAIPYWQATSDIYGEARTLNNLGVVYQNLGELERALKIYVNLESLWHKLGDRNGEARTVMNLGVVYSFLGERDKALSHYLRAKALWEAAEDRQGIPLLLDNIGLIYALSGDYDRAIEYHEQALQGARVYKLSNVEGLALGHLGEVYAAQGNAAALSKFTEALAIHRANQQRREEGRVLLNLAFVHKVANRRDQAIEYYEAALAVAKQTNQRWVEAGAHSQLGDLLVPASPTQAHERYLKALALFSQLRDPDGEATSLYKLAQLQRSQGNFSQARSYIETALTKVESLRAKVASHDLRAGFFATRQDYFEFYVTLLMNQHEQESQAGYDQLAWQVAERARARSLLDLLAEARAELKQGASSELLAQEKQVHAGLAGKLNLYLSLLDDGKLPKSNEVVKVESELNRLSTELEQVRGRIRTESPRYAALTLPEPLILNAVQQQLDDQTALLQFLLGNERSYVWLITREALHSYVLPPRAEIETLARQAYEQLTLRVPRASETEVQRIERLMNSQRADRIYWQTAAQLSRLLLGALADKLQGRQLVIVPDGALHYLPFGALPEPQQAAELLKGETAQAVPLIVNHEVVYLPSVSVLASLRQGRARQPASQQTIAIFADPVFAASDERVRATKLTPAAPKRTTTTNPLAATQSLAQAGPVLRDATFLQRLPQTRREAQTVAALVPAGQARLEMDFNASRALVVNAPLKQYRHLLFATHALFNDRQPALTGIVMSRVKADGNAQPGLLSLPDIYNLDLAAEVVTLSACQTALGKQVRGEGLIGLTHGFLYSGALRVVSSLWSVDESATYELMTQYYQAMLKTGLTPAAALRQAQVSLYRKAQRQAPYFWAAFTLHGEWR